MFCFCFTVYSPPPPPLPFPFSPLVNHWVDKTCLSKKLKKSFFLIWVFVVVDAPLASQFFFIEHGKN
jgi:hypothetical protein